MEALLPPPLRPLAAPLVTRPNRRHERAWFRLVRPEVERRLRARDAAAAAVGDDGDDGDGGEEKETDFLDVSHTHCSLLPPFAARIPFAVLPLRLVSDVLACRLPLELAL